MANSNKPPFKLTTKNGYNLDEVISSLQKEIRRAHEEEAMYWALELIESGFAKYLWRRLFVISSEDVSPLEAHIPPLLLALYRFTEIDIKESSGRNWSEHELMHVGKAVIVLARAKKNRIVDYFLTDISERKKKGWKLKPPPYAIDIHTEKGRQVRKDLGIKTDDYSEFYGEGVRIANEEKIDGGQKYRNKTLDHFNLNNLQSQNHPNNKNAELLLSDLS